MIWAHFGQIRHPETQTRYTPARLRKMLEDHANLYIDLATGQPDRRYPCNGHQLDTVIWQDAAFGGQKDTLKPEYKALLTDFSTHFVYASDYGGGRPPLPRFLHDRVHNARLIMRDLPEQAKHNIGYRNAWFLFNREALERSLTQGSAEQIRAGNLESGKQAFSLQLCP